MSHSLPAGMLPALNRDKNVPVSAVKRVTDRPHERDSVNTERGCCRAEVSIAAPLCRLRPVDVSYSDWLNEHSWTSCQYDVDVTIESDTI